jgi:hypothetical protein
VDLEGNIRDINKSSCFAASALFIKNIVSSMS